MLIYSLTLCYPSSLFNSVWISLVLTKKIVVFKKSFNPLSFVLFISLACWCVEWLMESIYNLLRKKLTNSQLLLVLICSFGRNFFSSQRPLFRVYLRFSTTILAKYDLNLYHISKCCKKIWRRIFFLQQLFTFLRMFRCFTVFVHISFNLIFYSVRKIVSSCCLHHFLFKSSACWIFYMNFVYLTLYWAIDRRRD